MSDDDKSVNDLKNAYKEINKRVASMGLCLSACRHPKTQELLFDLKEDEISIGCGVHGEAGLSTVKVT